ncbi:hypothetical protein ACWAUC_19645 [Bradyrhizobium guangdongense]
MGDFEMRTLILASFLCATSITAAYSQTNSKCDNPETIYVEAGQEYTFETGFMILSLQATIDPNGGNTHRGVAWGSAHGGNWFSVDNFKGPFFIKAGEKLLPRKPENDRAIVVSGYRCH